MCATQATGLSGKSVGAREGQSPQEGCASKGGLCKGNYIKKAELGHINPLPSGISKSQGAVLHAMPGCPGLSSPQPFPVSQLPVLGKDSSMARKGCLQDGALRTDVQRRGQSHCKTVSTWALISGLNSSHSLPSGKQLIN